MDKREFRDLMNRYLEGQLSEEEHKLFQKWYDSFGESENDVPFIESGEATQKLKKELEQRIEHIIREEKSPRSSVIKKHVFGWVSITAMLSTIFFSVALYFVQNHRQNTKTTKQQIIAYHEVRTGKRQVKKLSLADGSTVFINANSCLRLPKDMRTGKREVFLREGEAFFEVSRDTSRPFVVHTATIKVEVLGTAFNIKSYQSLNDVSVAVEHGKVRVSNGNSLLGNLLKNEGLTYQKSNGNFTKVTVNTSHIRAWKTGVIYLQKANFEELALAIFNLYGMHLYSNNLEIKQNHFNIKLQSNQSLDEMMEVICSIHNNRYRRQGNELILYP